MDNMEHVKLSKLLIFKGACNLYVVYMCVFGTVMC